uniref:Uncharacterized protein n=1 Tax=Anguilla anguilla TaxID=7936 RepID=A0A0E9S4P5_ANGAN
MHEPLYDLSLILDNPTISVSSSTKNHGVELDDHHSPLHTNQKIIRP